MSASARVLGPLALVLMLVIAGCGAGSSGPTTPIQPGATPAPSLDVVDASVCEATFTMEEGLARVKRVKVRRGSRGRLEQAMELVLTGQDALVQRAPYQMRTRLRALGLAVTNLTLAIEDVRTTARLDEAASNVKRSVTGLGKAIDNFQAWVGCDGERSDDAASPAPSVEG